MYRQSFVERLKSHSLHLKTVSRCHRKSLEDLSEERCPLAIFGTDRNPGHFFWGGEGGGSGEKDGQSAFVSKDYCFMAISAVYYIIDR